MKSLYVIISILFIVNVYFISSIITKQKGLQPKIIEEDKVYEETINEKKNTYDYQKVLEEYSSNTREFGEDSFSLFRKIKKITNDYVILALENKEVKVLFDTEIVILETSSGGENYVDFNPSLLKQGDFETFIISDFNKELNEFTASIVFRLEYL
jgi:hypothetical protein